MDANESSSEASSSNPPIAVYMRGSSNEESSTFSMTGGTITGKLHVNDKVGTVTISGGNITGGIQADREANVQNSGGTVSGTLGTYAPSGYIAGKYTITGGTFDTAQDSSVKAALVNGYALADNGDGTSTVYQLPTWYTQNNYENKVALKDALDADDVSDVDADEITTLKNGWDALNADEKKAVAADLGTTVDTIDEKLTALKDASDWATSADELYKKDTVTANDYATLQTLADNYENLGDQAKDLVKDIYNNIANKLAGAQVLSDNDDIISDEGPVDASDVDVINKALTDYNNLTEDQQEAIDPDGSIKADLEAKKAAADRNGWQYF